MSDDDRRAKVLHRVRKLLDRAQSPNEHEAATALRMAQELMEKHRIDEAEIGRHTGDARFDDGTVIAQRDELEQWREYLASWICRLNDCWPYVAKQAFHDDQGRVVTHRDSLCAVGTPEDLSVASYMTAYAERAVESMSREAWDGYSRIFGQKGRDGFVDAFCHGAAQRFVTRLKQRREELRMGAPETAIARLDQRIHDAEKAAKDGENIAPPNMQQRYVDMAGYRLGWEQGQKINLPGHGPQIGNGS